MTQFTTSKGDFIAIPVPEGVKDFVLNQANKYSGLEYTLHGIYQVYTWLRDYPGVDFELIGLSSDILKDEELAEKVCTVYHGDILKVFKGCLDTHNITGNQLIIKKK